MSFIKKIKARFRTNAASARSCPGWERDIAMIQFHEADLQRAAEKGLLPEGTLDYAKGIIEITIQGKTVTKSRWQWAQFKNSQPHLPSFPYRSYDSDITKGKNIHDALLDLALLNKTYPEMSIDELNYLIQKKFW
jgi:hypothetical protein